MRLKEIRIMAGISQKTLAENLNLSVMAISKYERGLCDPSNENLIKMADFFNVSTDTLLGRDSKLIDLNTLSADQQKVVDAVVNRLSDNSVAKVVGYIENVEK